jgi:hypothetical protein
MPIIYNRIRAYKTTTQRKDMSYKPYQIRMTKETPTGIRHLVKCNNAGKYAIAYSVSEDQCSMSPEHQGSYIYIMNIWKKMVGKYIPKS